ncbi:MAG: hypothetical protein ACI4F4_05960 [Lachnospiraceae bacterium]
MNEKSNLLIIGAGQYGHLVKEIVELLECYDKIEFIDDNSKEAIGTISNLEQLSGEYHDAIVAIGNPEIKTRMMELLETYHYNVVTVIHPQSIISKSCVIGKGCVIEAGVILNTDVHLEDGVFVSAGAVVNHNSYIGKCVHIDCNSVVESGCNVPANLKIHSGQVFLRDM